jgi:uncharacterized protein (TIGR03435 family)
MKKPWILFFAALLAGSLHAQNITGTWQGTLKPGPRDFRIVIKFSLEDDRLKAVMYSIDQAGGQPIIANSTSRDGSTIKMTVTMIGGSYEGKLSADGNSITGTWAQGARLPLNLTRATPETAWTIPDPPPPPVRMATGAKPGFEVATIKPSDPNRPGKLFTVRGQNVVTINTTLNDLIKMAYDLHARQIAGGPAWTETEKFDVTAKPDAAGQPSVAQIKILMQQLLADRFQLKFHREKKELNVYAIMVGKTGVKFGKSERDPNSLPGLFFRGPGTNVNVTNATIPDFANLLQSVVLDKPVVDQTGLSEKYDFTLKWTPDPGQLLDLGGPPQRPADNADAPPDLFTAIQQQLGLKLESTKAPADVLVIDRVEKPAEN